MKGKSHIYIIAPEVIQIHTNTNHVPQFAFQEKQDKHFSGESSQTKITFNIVKEIPTPSFNNMRKFGFITGEPEADEIYYERPIAGPIKAKMQIKQLAKNPVILVNNIYNRLIKLRVGGVNPPTKYLDDIAIVKLLERKFMILHGASICSDEKGILIVAPPDTGKSLTALLAIERGFSFLSEDIAITDGEYVYSCPLTASFAHSINFADNLKALKPRRRAHLGVRLLNFMHNKIPFLAYIVKLPDFDISAFAKSLPIVRRAKIEHIFFLNRGRRNVIELDKETALRQLLILNRCEFNYYENEVLFYYSYLNPKLNLAELMETEQRILAKTINGSNCYSCTSNNPTEYIQLIEQKLI